MSRLSYAVNSIWLYGAITALQAEIHADRVRADISIRTIKTEEPHVIEVYDRRALECLAFYHSHVDMYPDLPLMATVHASLRTREGCNLVIANEVTFHIPHDVRKSAGRAFHHALKKYAAIYGAQPWFEMPEC